MEVDLHGAAVREPGFEVVAHGVAALGDAVDVGVPFEQSSDAFPCQWHACAPFRFCGFPVSTFRLPGLVGFGRQPFEFGLFCRYSSSWANGSASVSRAAASSLSASASRSVSLPGSVAMFLMIRSSWLTMLDGPVR